jgi:hypothetical protein
VATTRSTTPTSIKNAWRHFGETKIMRYMIHNLKYELYGA